LRPQGSVPIASGQSLEQLEAALDALPYSASRVLAARVEGRFRAPSRFAASPSSSRLIARWRMS
jgi:hypothetical protein